MRKKYIHERRHNHTKGRPRGEGGKHFTADQLAKLNQKTIGEGDMSQEPGGIPKINLDEDDQRKHNSV